MEFLSVLTNVVINCNCSLVINRFSKYRFKSYLCVNYLCKYYYKSGEIVVYKHKRLRYCREKYFSSTLFQGGYSLLTNLHVK